MGWLLALTNYQVARTGIWIGCWGLFWFFFFFFRCIFILAGKAFLFVCSWSKLAKKQPGISYRESPEPARACAQAEAAETSKINCGVRACKGREGKSWEVRKVCEEAERQGEGHCKTIRAYIMFFLLDVSHFSVSRRECVCSVCPTLTHPERTDISHRLCHVFIS